jgi:hypothetical protein
MKFLIFLLWIIFYFIFFLFSLEKWNSYNSLLWSLFIEAHIYIATSLIFLFFLFISRRAQKEISPLGDDDENWYQLNITRNDILKFVWKFFTQFAYILAILLFYLGIWLMFQSIVWSFHIPIMFLLFNILVLWLFFIEHKFMVFQDFLRINTGIISIYYIFIHIYYILGGSIALWFYDIVNIVLLFVLFYFFLRTERKSQYKYIMQSYVIAFIFLEVLVVLKYFFSFEPTLYSFMSWVFAMIFFVFPQQLNQQFKIHIFLSRIWGIVFSYFFLIFLSISLFDINLWVIILCLVSFLISLILLEFHKKFENYVALLWASYGSFIWLLWLFLAFLNQDFIEHYITIFLYFISLIYLIFDVVRKKSYVYDSYFFHVFSLLVNLSCLISFFFFIDFSILNTGLFLIAESLYFFYSYFSLRKTFKKWSTIS